MAFILNSNQAIYNPAGNINQLILRMESYAAALEETKGVIAEFVNPKYKDTSKQAFKSPTRLECMMQDFPRALPASAAVGFTVINQVRFAARLGRSRILLLYSAYRFLDQIPRSSRNWQHRCCSI